MKIKNDKKLGVSEGHFHNGCAFFDHVCFSDIRDFVEEPNLDEGIMLNLMKSDDDLFCFGRIFEDGNAIIDGFRGFLKEDTKDRIERSFETVNTKRSENYYYYTELK